MLEGCNLGGWNKEILKLWDFPQFSQGIEVDPENKRVVIGSRSFKVPALISLNEDGTAMLTFEFDSPAEYLSKAAEDKKRKDPFILVTTKGQAPTLLDKENGSNADWYVITGSAGEVHQIFPVKKSCCFQLLS